MNIMASMFFIVMFQGLPSDWIGLLPLIILASRPARERFAGSVWASGRFSVNQCTWLYGCRRREQDLPHTWSCKRGTPLSSSGKLTGKWWSLFIFLTKSFQLPLPPLCLGDRWAGYRSLAPGFVSLQTQWFYGPLAYVILSNQIVEQWKRFQRSFSKWSVHSTLPSPKQPLSHSMFTHHHHLDGTDLLSISFFQNSCQVSYSWETFMLTEMTAKLEHMPFSTGKRPTHHYVPQIFQKLWHKMTIEQTSVRQNRCPWSLLISWPNIVETPLLKGFSCVWAMSRQHFVDSWFQNLCVRDPARLPQTGARDRVPGSPLGTSGPCWALGAL